MRRFTAVTDLGKRRDAVCLMLWRADWARSREHDDLYWWEFVIRALAKWERIRYRQVVKDIAHLLNHPELEGDYDFLVDGAHVGEAVIEMMREEDLTPIPIITTGGQTVREIKAKAIFSGNRDGQLTPLQTIEELHVPKNDLVASGIKLAQARRVHLSAGLKWAPDFRKQMEGFRGFRNVRTGNIRYEAEGEFEHDDWPWCYCTGAWWCLRQGDEQSPAEVTVARQEHLRDWDPLEEA